MESLILLLGITVILPILAAAFAAWIRWRIRRIAVEPRRCAGCGYLLVGIYCNRCPECGSIIQWNGVER